MGRGGWHVFPGGNSFSSILSLKDKLFGLEKQRHSGKREQHIQGKPPWSSVEGGFKMGWARVGREERQKERRGEAGGGDRQREGEGRKMTTCSQSLTHGIPERTGS